MAATGRTWWLCRPAPGSLRTTPGARGGMQFNGSPGYGNQLLLDGVDMTFGEITSAPTDQAGGAGTSLIGGTSIGAISEVKVNSNSFSAEYGSAASGVVNITDESGTNAFHGEAFEFFRNDELNANDFFSNKSRTRQAAAALEPVRRKPGRTHLKNRLFFFFNYEGARVDKPTQFSG